MVSAHVCGILATRARQVFFDGTDGSDDRQGEAREGGKGVSTD
jgi:hypothetical protein